jgi:hypothetical protein
MSFLRHAVERVPKLPLAPKSRSRAWVFPQKAVRGRLEANQSINDPGRSPRRLTIHSVRRSLDNKEEIWEPIASRCYLCVGREIEGVQGCVFDADLKNHILPGAACDIVVTVPLNDMFLTVADDRIRQALEVGATQSGFDVHMNMAAGLHIRIQCQLTAAEVDSLGGDDVFAVVCIFKSYITSRARSMKPCELTIGYSARR